MTLEEFKINLLLLGWVNQTVNNVAFPSFYKYKVMRMSIGVARDINGAKTKIPQINYASNENTDSPTRHFTAIAHALEVITNDIIRIYKD